MISIFKTFFKNKKDVLPTKTTWRETEPEACQLGQALFYVLGHQLAHVRYRVPPPPELALYMAEGQVGPRVNFCDCFQTKLSFPHFLSSLV